MFWQSLLRPFNPISRRSICDFRVCTKESVAIQAPAKNARSHEWAIGDIVSIRGIQLGSIIVDASIYEQEVYQGIAQKYRDS